MTTSASRSAYWTEYEILDRAVAAKHGIRAQFDDVGEAYQLYTRLHRARQLERVLQGEVRGLDDPKQGASAYDKLVVKSPRKVQGKWCVRIAHIKLPDIVEEIEDDKGSKDRTQRGDATDVRHGGSGEVDSNPLRRLSRTRL